MKATTPKKAPAPKKAPVTNQAGDDMKQGTKHIEVAKANAKAGLEAARAAIAEGYAKVVLVIKNVGTIVWDSVKAAWGFVSKQGKRAFQWTKEAMMAFAHASWDMIKGLLGAMYDLVCNLAKAAWAAVVSVWDALCVACATFGKSWAARKPVTA